MSYVYYLSMTLLEVNNLSTKTYIKRQEALIECF